jgi:small conductance mechanosensitive channel
LTTYILNPVVPASYLRYIQVSEVVLVGFFAIYTISEISYSLSIAYSEQTAKSIRSLIRIAGAIIVIAVSVSYLSQDPVIAASISTISGLVIGFAASNLIGNIIAGIYLAITRPFRIGDRKVFNGDGRVSDIGLLYTRLLLDNGDEMLASNSSMVTTNIILRKKEKEEGNQKQ